MTGHTEAIDRYRGKAYRRLFSAARRSLERTGWDLTGAIGVANPDDTERNAIIGITGRYRPPGVKRLEIALQELDAAVHGSTGLTLTELLEKIGPKLANRPADNAKDAAARQDALSVAYDSFLHETADWYRAWLAGLTRDGTVTKLLGRNEGVAITHAVGVLEFLEARPPGSSTPIMLPALSAVITHDTKALNPGTSLSTLVLRALAQRAGVPKPKTAEDRRELWDRFDVVVDDLASRVLVLNLAAEGVGLGEWLTGAAQSGTPFYVTLHQIITLPIAAHHSTVHVCENPAVLRRAAGELGPRSLPLICTEGRPSTAFHRLAKIITTGGGKLRYHGDFDWPGIAIATGIFERHNADPWRMTSTDYLAGLTESEHHVDLTGRPLPTPWDPELARTMRAQGKRVYEEVLGDPLISDLAVSG